MKLAYLDCSMGISGDMTLAALIDAGIDEETIRSAIDSLNLPGVELKTQVVVKGGFRATYVKVKHPEQHAHRHLSDIHRIIEGSKVLTDSQQSLALKIFTEIATAEAKVHDSTIEKVHFHEVGAIDSIVDIVGAAVAFDLLGANRIICSEIPTGRGQIKIDHGICTVPAPGTTEILKGIPLVDVPVEAELTTPTGAAIVKSVVDEFGNLPAMTIESIGYGAGTRDFPSRANLLRIFVGEAVGGAAVETVTLLETNLDDVSPEVIGYAREQLFAAGALDVWVTPIQMKKDRPGVLLSVLSLPKDVGDLESILFSETGTLGVRQTSVIRSICQRSEYEVETRYGTVTGKIGWREGELPVFTPEYESCARIAREANVPLRDICRAALSQQIDGSVIGELQAEMRASSQSARRQKADTAHAEKTLHDHDHDHG